MTDPNTNCRFPYLLTDEPKDWDAEYERMIEKEEMKADERRDDERKENSYANRNLRN